MLRGSELKLLKTSLPLIREHGALVIFEFLKELFAEYPEYKMLFSRGGSLCEDSLQVTVIANAIYKYVSDIESTSRLKEMINDIASKHVSIGVGPQCYECIGSSFMKAMCNVMKLDERSPYVQVWMNTYFDFADSLIKEQSRLSNMREKRKNFWDGFEPFVVTDKRRISNNAFSIQLKPKSGNKLPYHDAGQYVSLQIPGLEGTRQYSLTAHPNEEYYEIAVKDVDGEFSTYLSEDIRLNDKVLLAMPSGRYIYRPMVTPVVLISGGIGVTPNLGIMRMLVDIGVEQVITHIFSIPSESQYHFREVLNNLRKCNSNIRQLTYISKRTSMKEDGLKNQRLSKAELIRVVKSMTNATFMICGPNGFKSMVFEALNDVGVPLEHINLEFFGPCSSEMKDEVPGKRAAF